MKFVALNQVDSSAADAHTVKPDSLCFEIVTFIPKSTTKLPLKFEEKFIADPNKLVRRRKKRKCFYVSL